MPRKKQPPPNNNAHAFDAQREHMHRQIFTAVSHDLKTPLSSMIGSLEIHQRMQAKLTDEKKNALIETALQEAYRLDNFVTNILDMAKLESGMLTLRKEPFRLDRLIQDCLTRMDNRLKNSEVTLNADDAFGLEGESDTALLCRALMLVMDNAVKYGGEPSKIRVRFGRISPQKMYIDVIDNGSGVPPAQREKIFEKYTRFTKTDLQNAGTGLGLPICRGIMEFMGGSVEMEDAKEGGAQFSLLFPA